LVPTSPGRGIRIRYGIADVWEWALSLAFLECGLPPAAVKSVIGVAGKKLTVASAGAGGPTEDQIFWLRSEFLSWHLDDVSDWTNKVRFNVVPYSSAMDAAFKQEGCAQILMINLSRLKKNLFNALRIDEDCHVGA
jgi:hypothetical protein